MCYLWLDEQSTAQHSEAAQARQKAAAAGSSLSPSLSLHPKGVKGHVLGVVHKRVFAHAHEQVTWSSKELPQGDPAEKRK